MTKTTLHVTHSQFWLSELDGLEAVSPSMYSGFNGLISAHGFLAIVMTGTESGIVGLTVDWRQTEPALELDEWDEVVEVSMQFDEPATVSEPIDNDTRDLPTLSPGSYRVRAHARGRDHGHEHPVVDGIPLEEHILIAWPAPNEPEIIHKLTGDYGAGIRDR